MELNHPNLSLHHPPPKEPTSFWCGELLNFTAWPISSPVGYNHLKLVVAVRKQPGHYAPVSVSRKTHILPFFGDPQVLQQTTVSPEIGLQETCMASEAFPMSVQLGCFSFINKSRAKLCLSKEHLVAARSLLEELMKLRVPQARQVSGVTRGRG